LSTDTKSSSYPLESQLAKFQNLFRDAGIGIVCYKASQCMISALYSVCRGNRKP